MISFYNPQKILSYNAMLNMVLGARAIGKTFGFKDYCIKNCIGTGKKFIYLRRYKTEVNGAKMRSFFTDINYKYDNKLTVKGNAFYYDNECIGYAVPLSTYVSLKGVVWNDVYYCIFDEFLIQEGSYRYLQNEFTTFCEFLATLSRFDSNGNMRKIKIFMLSNAISFVNPYFANYHIDLPLNFKGIYRVNEQCVLEVNDNKAFTESMKETDLFKALAGTGYTDYAYSNNTLLDSDDFISKKPPNARYYATLLNDGNKYSIWINYDSDGVKFYLCEGNDDNYPVKLYIDRLDNVESYNRIKDIKRLMPHITTALAYGMQSNNFYYESILLKGVGELLYKALC